MRLSPESAARALALVKAIEVKFILGDMLACCHIIKLRILEFFFNNTLLCLLPLQLSMFHKYEFYLRPTKTLIKYARDPNFVCGWDDIKILGLVVCPFVCKSVCVYVGH